MENVRDIYWQYFLWCYFLFLFKCFLFVTWLIISDIKNFNVKIWDKHLKQISTTVATVYHICLTLRTTTTDAPPCKHGYTTQLLYVWHFCCQMILLQFELEIYIFDLLLKNTKSTYERLTVNPLPVHVKQQ